jgi:DHA2 family multidrug resistance protein-like MFS transporter
MASTPPERAGSAASIQETGGEFGVAMGVALMGSLGTFVYRAGVTEAAPAGLPPEAAAAANDGIASAMAAAQQLPGALGAQLADTARTAFTAGFNVVGLASTVIFVVVTILAATLLRRIGRPETPAPAPERELVGVN